MIESKPQATPTPVPGAVRPATPMALESDFQVYTNGNVRPHRYRFDPGDPAFVSRNASGTLTFRLLAPVDTVEGVLAVRIGERVLGYPLERIGAAGAISSWEVSLQPPADRFEFTLALLLEGEIPVYIARTGITSAVERIDRFVLDVADVPSHEVPAWAAGSVMYQIFPERFASGDPSLSPPNVEPWHTTPTSRSFLGGDLPGITDNVPHLVELGVDVVYLNPIFTSPSNHRYDTVDYLNVDPSLGGNDALRSLVGTLHGHGIRMILDTSFNHCHPSFFAFADLIARGPDSVYADWFVVRDWPVRVQVRRHMLKPGSFWRVHIDRLQAESEVPVEYVSTGDGRVVQPTYDAWYDVPLMPRLNLANPEARRYMLDVAAHWVREFDVDGWRMDVVRYVDYDFWAELRREVRAAKPDAYLLAEVMGDARRWLRGDEFDGVMNYTFRDLAIDYFAKAAIDTEGFVEGLLEMRAMYSPAASALSQNLIGSHDTPRFLTVAGGDERMLLLATLVQLTFPGIAGLYYGDELAMAGAGDPDSRRGMTWDSLGNVHHSAVVALSQLRRSSPSLRHGGFRLVGLTGEAFAYERSLDGEAVTVAVNRGDEDAVLPVQGIDEVLWSTGEVVPTSAGIRLGPGSGAVMR